MTENDYIAEYIKEKRPEIIETPSFYMWKLVKLVTDSFRKIDWSKVDWSKVDLSEIEETQDEEEMSRQECESKIFDLLMDIKKVYKEYNPSGNYLALCIGDEEYVNIANRYYGEDAEKPIHYCGLRSEYKTEEEKDEDEE